MLIKSKTAVAPYKSDAEAKSVLKELRHVGFNMNRVSIIGCDHLLAERVVGYHTAGERMNHWGGGETFWGGIWGPLFGCASVLIPDSGPLVIAGPLVGWIVEAMEDAVLRDGKNTLEVALRSLDVAAENVVEYETALTSGKCLLIAHGREADAKLARKIMAVTHPDAWVENTRPWAAKHPRRSLGSFRGSAQRERNHAARAFVARGSGG